MAGEDYIMLIFLKKLLFDIFSKGDLAAVFFWEGSFNPHFHFGHHLLASNADPLAYWRDFLGSAPGP